MKTKLIILLLGILITTSSFANNKGLYKYAETDKIHERFTVSANSQLEIENKYGNIVVVEGKQNEITIDVTIEMKASKERTIEEMRKGINIDIYKLGNKVVGITEIDMSDIDRVRKSFTIDYQITVPKDYIPTITNKYGSIKLESVATNADIEIKYGNFSAQILKGTTQLESKYSGVRIEKAENIEIGMGYGNSNITEAGEITIGEYKYGNLSIGSVDVVNIEEFKYGNLAIDMLNRSFICSEIKYSKLNIKECSLEVERVEVQGGYTPIYVTLPKMLKFKSELSTRYGKIRNEHSSRMSISELEADGSSVVEKSKTKGASSSIAIIDISTSYSNITISEE